VPQVADSCSRLTQISTEVLVSRMLARLIISSKTWKLKIFEVCGKIKTFMSPSTPVCSNWCILLKSRQPRHDIKVIVSYSCGLCRHSSSVNRRLVLTGRMVD